MIIKCHICGTVHSRWSNSETTFVCANFSMHESCHSILTIENDEIITYDMLFRPDLVNKYTLSANSYRNTTTIYKLYSTRTKTIVLTTDKYLEPTIIDDVLKIDHIVNKLFKLKAFL